MKIKQILFTLVLLAGFSVIFLAPSASAEVCDGYETSILPCNGSKETCPDGNAPDSSTGLCSDGSKPNGIWGILSLGVNILTGLIGVAAVGGFVYAGILYASAGGSSDNIKKAKDTIRNIVIGLIAYSLMFALLNFIIPGGLI